jgi:hypothetical protein
MTTALLKGLYPLQQHTQNKMTLYGLTLLGLEIQQINEKMSNRRNFIQRIAGLGGAVVATPFLNSAQGLHLLKELNEKALLSADETADDEDFWYLVQQAYTTSPNIINLNNGGVSPSPKVVQEAVERYNRFSNEAPTYYMWRILDQGREPLREKLAALAGCNAEELAINRNSSEAIETVIFGLRLKAGDEVVLTKQDYPNMINAWKQRAHRDGIVLKWLNFDFPIENERTIVEAFVKPLRHEPNSFKSLTLSIGWGKSFRQGL